MGKTYGIVTEKLCLFHAVLTGLQELRGDGVGVETLCRRLLEKHLRPGDLRHVGLFLHETSGLLDLLDCGSVLLILLKETFAETEKTCLCRTVSSSVRVALVGCDGSDVKDRSFSFFQFLQKDIREKKRHFEIRSDELGDILRLDLIVKSVEADSCAVDEKIDRLSLGDVPDRRFDLGSLEQVKFDFVKRYMLIYIPGVAEIPADSVDFIVHIEESLTDGFPDSGRSSGDDGGLCHFFSLSRFTI